MTKITCTLGLMLVVQALSFAQANIHEYEVFNRTIEKINEGDKEFFRLSEAPNSGVAWLKGREFGEGTIEFDTRGRDKLQGSFIGVAFHGVDNHTYEAIYFRPFNFQATDPVRRIHAVQYIYEPKFTWKYLRDNRNGEFEKEIVPSDLQATDWIHAKVEVKNGRIKVYANGSERPCLDVPTLNPEGKKGKIGFWVGDNANGDFMNLKIN